MSIVDAHPHIYSPDRDAYPTIEEPWEPGEPASVEDLKKMMDAVGVDRAIFIQTSTFYGHDNRYVMDSAKEHASWAGGVVTLDPDDESHVELLEEAVAGSNIRGMRGTTDSLNRIATPNVYRLWTKAMELGIPVNCMVMDDLERVPEIERVAQDLGDLKIVIDHCFMLNTRHQTEETLVALERLAQLPNVYAKLTSGTHGSYRVYPYPDMHDPLKRVIDAFGPKRCVWGSNFPNALWSKGASYAQNLHLFVKELGLSLPDKADILGMTAMSLWFPQEYREEEQAQTEQQERTERESVQAIEDAEPPVVEDESDEAKGHVAQITQMADLIAAEGNVEGPILEQVDDVELSAILDAANELNAVLDTVEAPKKPAPKKKKKAAAKKSEPKPEPQPEAIEEVDEPEPEADVTVDLDELMAGQNYTPIKTDEIGGDHVAEADIASDVQAQLDAALGSVEEPGDIELEIEEEESDLPAETEPEINVAELLAAQEAATSDEAASNSANEPELDEVADIAADVQAQLDAALGTAGESPEIELEIVEDEAEPSDTDSETTINVEELLAAQAEAGPAEIEEAPEADVAADVEAQLAAALDTVNADDAAADNAVETSEPSTESVDVEVNVEALLAAQAPESDAAEQATEVETEDGDIDLTSVLEAAEQLNAALESGAPEEPEAAGASRPTDKIDPEFVQPTASAINEPEINVDELLAAQNQASAATDEIEPPSEPADEPAASDDADEFDVDALMDVADQLNSMLESVEDVATNINELASDAEAEQPDDQSERPSA